jgi:nucleoside-diphosphate-sugar epimerase
MRVLLTGGTGFVGSAVLCRLVEAGHQVDAVVRSESAAARVSSSGARPVIGALDDTVWLRSCFARADAAIHTATADGEGAAVLDDAVIDAVTTAFAGSERPYLHTGGLWVYGSGRITEDSAFNPPPIAAWREARQRRLLASDIAATMIAPGIAYGYGRGIPRVLIDAPRGMDGALTLVGSGEQHWTTVHVDDLADLYLLALANGPAHEVVHGASGTNPTVRELGLAIVGPGGSVQPDTEDATRARLGREFADALLLDQQASGDKARRTLGWTPHRPSLVAELSAI